MATTNILPIYIRIGSRISQTLLGTTARRRGVGNTELLAGFDRLWLALRCPMHAWSWPRANRDERLEGYDAHQTCCKCTSRRMFDTREWQAGPVYRKRDQGIPGPVRLR